jgi:hypothetical protein
MSINELKKALCEGVDMARADLWETNDLVSLNEPTDVHGEVARGQAARAEIWQAVIDYREERIDFNELLMSLQAFDREVTAWDVTKLLSGIYK